jgi:hypothetical protein
LNAAGAVVWNGRFIGGRNELIVAHLAAGLYILETKTNQYRVVIQR